MRRGEQYVWSGRLRNLRPILDAWTKLQLRAHDEWTTAKEPECAWWYNERASIGILAAACWKVGGTALEEYSNTKGAADAEAYTGRCDLFLSRAGREYQIEAKHHWSRLDSSQRVMRKRLRTAIDRARGDLKCVRDSECTGLAAVFVVPSIRESDPPSMVEAMERWFDMIHDIDVDARAYVHPSAAWNLRHRGRVYPAVALLLKHA